MQFVIAVFPDHTHLLLFHGSLVEQNHLCNFGKRHHEEQFCEIILNLDQSFWICRIKIFLFCSAGGPFVQLSRTICSIFVEGIMR